MDASGLLQTALGAGVVLVANHISHRYRATEAILDARRALYVGVVRHLYKLQRSMGPERDGDPNGERELILEIEEIQAELEILGSRQVVMAIERLYAAMSGHFDPDAPHDQHQDAVLLALGEEAENVIEIMRDDVHSTGRRWRRRQKVHR